MNFMAIHKNPYLFVCNFNFVPFYNTEASKCFISRVCHFDHQDVHTEVRLMDCNSIQAGR